MNYKELLESLIISINNDFSELVEGRQILSLVYRDYTEQETILEWKEVPVTELILSKGNYQEFKYVYKYTKPLTDELKEVAYNELAKSCLKHILISKSYNQYLSELKK